MLSSPAFTYCDVAESILQAICRREREPWRYRNNSCHVDTWLMIELVCEAHDGGNHLAPPHQQLREAILCEGDVDKVRDIVWQDVLADPNGAWAARYKERGDVIDRVVNVP